MSESHISGIIKLDNTWDNKVYLSYIPIFNDMHLMSNEMIIAQTDIDDSGYFQFEINFLPKENKLYRIHITKKGDSPMSIIIGGKYENHLFFIANRNSNIEIETSLNYPPFRKTVFRRSNQNKLFQKITDMVYYTDSVSSKSSFAKRQFIENKMYEELKLVADTTAHPLISLYALYKSDFESFRYSDYEFYESYLKKWSSQNNFYFNSFKQHFPKKNSDNRILIILVTSGLSIIFGFLLGRFGKATPKKKIEISKLSVQERKIYQLLKQGASNQEIADEYNVGISTVKSHVSSILTKLKMKSRKEIMNFK